MAENALIQGGIHICALKCHGKSRLAFILASYLRKRKKTRVIVFDSSYTWFKGFEKIPTFEVNIRDIQINSVKSTFDIEKFKLINKVEVKLALATYKDILFTFDKISPSRKGFFIRQVVNMLDNKQQIEGLKANNGNAKQNIAYFIEEAENAFTSRSTARNDCEMFLQTFNEARNNKETFFTLSQRLTDFSKTIREKQVKCLGKIGVGDISGDIRRIEKQSGVDLANMPRRTWLYEGKRFISPEWTIKTRRVAIRNKQIINA